MDEHKGADDRDDESVRLRRYAEGLEARLEELREENYHVRAENEELQKRVDQDLAADLAYLEGENEALEERLHQLEDWLDPTLLASVERLERENEALDREAWQLRDLLSRRTADEVDLLRSEVVELREQLSQLECEQGASSIDLGAGSDEERVYIASRNRSRFHRPGCKWAQFILNSPALIEFGSHREAVEAGYRPCGTCRA